jgi:hypothetical protein
MNASEFQEFLGGLSEKELLRYAREYTRRCIAESDDPRSETHWMLDLVFGECVLRGKEWLYDKAREHVVRESGAIGAEIHTVRRRHRQRDWAVAESLQEDETRDLYLEIG